MYQPKQWMEWVSWEKGIKTTWPAVKKRSPSVYTIDETKLQIPKEETKYKKAKMAGGSIGERERVLINLRRRRRRKSVIDYLPTSIKQLALVFGQQIPPLKRSTVAWEISMQ